MNSSVPGVGSRSHCPYCALQCGIHLEGSAGEPRVRGDETFPVNRGALCVKGWTSIETLRHPERLLAPLGRDRAGALVPIDWAEAFERVAAGFRLAQERYGRHAVGLYGGGSLTNEKAYLLGKLARYALRSSSIDYNGRFCMSSAASATTRALGIDRGLPFPVADIPHADVVLLAGANPGETMPPLLAAFHEQIERGGRLVTVDPRETATSALGALHLPLTPGTDAALANGILHILVRDGWVRNDYVVRRTEGFENVRASVAAYWPERVERITGVAQGRIEAAARMLGTARTAMILTARGAEQHVQGVGNTLAYINVALALGLPGREASGFGTLTGQGNGQGGREHGQKADQLPGYRAIDDPAARAHVASVWGMSADDIPVAGRSAYEMLDAIGSPEGIRALLVMGSNPVVSSPHAAHAASRLKALDLLVVADFFLSETASLAHVVLPAAQWAEEEGSTTNLEGRVIHRRRAWPPPDGVRTDVEILCALGRALGRGDGFAFAGPRQVFDELRRASAGGPADYSGMSYERLDRDNGIFWPCPDVDHPGTPRLFAERFPTPSGRARFHTVRHEDPHEALDDAYPLVLTTGRILAQYQTGTQTRRVRKLNEMATEAVAELAPAVARAHGLIDGDRMRLATRRGTATFRVRVRPGMRADTIFVPFHWGGEGCVNRLTSPALDPISRMPSFKACAARVVMEEDKEGSVA